MEKSTLSDAVRAKMAEYRIPPNYAPKLTRIAAGLKQAADLNVKADRFKRMSEQK